MGPGSGSVVVTGVPGREPPPHAIGMAGVPPRPSLRAGLRPLIAPRSGQATRGDGERPRIAPGTLPDLVATLSAMTEEPETRFARVGDVHIAYQAVGDGPIDILFVDIWVHHVEAVWDFPEFARLLRRLASFGRLIHFDRRGTGLSDRYPWLTDEPPYESREPDDDPSRPTRTARPPRKRTDSAGKLQEGSLRQRLPALAKGTGR